MARSTKPLKPTPVKLDPRGGRPREKSMTYIEGLDRMLMVSAMRAEQPLLDVRLFANRTVSGALAVFLALVYSGPWIALWMLVVVLGVQQLEGHVLQPLLMGSAVKVHPLAVVLVVAGGAMVAGIPGALFAVPLAAFVNVVAVYLSERAWETGADPRATADLIWTTVPRTRRTRA